jgi:hypothetical protein
METRPASDVAQLSRNKEQFPEKRFCERKKSSAKHLKKLSLAEMKCAYSKSEGRGSNPYLRVRRVESTGISQTPRVAASASCASWFSNEKNAGDWPMKSPMSVKNVTTPMAIPFVFVGRMTEHLGSVGLMNAHGSGMIRLV